MYRVKYNWLAWAYDTTISDFSFEFLDLFLNIVLNHLNPLNYYIFKYSLALLHIHVSKFIILIYFMIQLRLKLEVHAARVVEQSVHLSCTYACANLCREIAKPRRRAINTASLLIQDCASLRRLHFFHAIQATYLLINLILNLDFLQL